MHVYILVLCNSYLMDWWGLVIYIVMEERCLSTLMDILQVNIESR